VEYTGNDTVVVSDGLGEAGCGVLDVVSAVYGVSIRDVEYPWY